MLFLNRVILAGRLKDNPEVRYTPQGKPVVVFTLSLPSEEPAGLTLPCEDVSVRVILVNSSSTHWSKRNVRAGRNLLIEGSLLQRCWETAGGVTEREIEIVAHTVKEIG